MADTEAVLLPGERLLWTGRPARARVIPGDLIIPGLLLAALLAALALSVPRSPADAPGGFGDEVVAAAAALAGVIATGPRRGGSAPPTSRSPRTSPSSWSPSAS